MQLKDRLWMNHLNIKPHLYCDQNSVNLRQKISTRKPSHQVRKFDDLLAAFPFSLVSIALRPPVPGPTSMVWGKCAISNRLGSYILFTLCSHFTHLKFNNGNSWFEINSLEGYQFFGKGQSSYCVHILSYPSYCFSSLSFV